MAAMDLGGTTPFIFANLAQVVGQYPGLKLFADMLIDSSGVRVPKVWGPELNSLTRAGELKHIHVFS